MRPAVRTPMRASKLDPASVFNQTSRSPVFNRCFASGTTPALRTISPSSFSFPSRAALCRQCLRGQSVSPRYQYSTRTSSVFSPVQMGRNPRGQSQSRSGWSRQRVIKYAVIGGVLGVGAVAYSDKVQHGYRAVERTGRVVGALAVCINE